MTLPRNLTPPAPPRRRPALLWTLAAALLAAPLSCNRDPCAGLHPPSRDKDAPKLVEVAINDQDTINPWQFNMALTFTDANGDLAGGQLDVYIGSSEPVTLLLWPYFATSQVANNATAGRIGIDLNLASSSVQDDTVLRLGFQVRDALLNYSNCYTLDLHVAVDRLGQVLPGSLRRAACGSRLALRSSR